MKAINFLLETWKGDTPHTKTNPSKSLYAVELGRGAGDVGKLGEGLGPAVMDGGINTGAGVLRELVDGEDRGVVPHAAGPVGESMGVPVMGVSTEE